MLVRKFMGLTQKQAREMTTNGFKLRFIALGACDKDFYDVYL